MKVRLFIALCLVLISFYPLVAGVTGKIAGRVIDAESGEGLPNANVIIDAIWFDDIEVDIANKQGAASDPNGNFSVLNIEPGVYTVRAMMIGYMPVRITNVAVNIDLTTRLEFRMNVQALQGQEITIVAEKELIRKDMTSSQAMVGSEQISAMPVESFNQVLEQKAGVVMGSGGEMHVRGGRSSEVSFMVDGISVTDPYSSSMGIQVENNAIQELQMISGTFNAEYGQAMSGIINIVTKEGNFSRYSGDFSYYMGDYVSNHDNIFYNIDEINPNGVLDFQGSLSGPLFKDRLSFYFSGRYLDDQGYLFSQRKYYTDSYYYDNDSTDWVLKTNQDGTTNSGDKKVVALAPEKQLSGQLKLSYIFNPALKLTFNAFWGKNDYRLYSHKFRYNPDGNYQRYRDNYNLIMTLNHTISPTTFYSLKYSYLYNNSEYYGTEDPADTSYYNVNPKILSDFSGYKFYIGGTQMSHFYRNSKVSSLKGEITSQVTNAHQLKGGFEFKMSDMFMKEYTLLMNSSTNWLPVIPSPENGYTSSSDYNTYTHLPKEYTFYVQDKIELQDLIVNIGLRYELFDPDAQMPVDMEDPNINSPLKPENIAKTLEQRREYWYKDASVKHQISPRVGIAYPITDQGVIHFSYGHFLQIPTYNVLYDNPDFEVPAGVPFLGNPDLEPQKTVQYEIGLQQQIAADLALDVTAYYKDIRNLLSSEIKSTFGGTDRYIQYVNKDFGNIRGITFSLTKRFSNYFSADVDYTYGIAEGNASDPQQAYYNASDNLEEAKQLVVLDWDQTHTLNATVTFGKPGSWNLSFIGNYGSGLPYTPAYQGLRTSFQNDGRKPMEYNIDMRFSKDFKYGRYKYSLFLNVYNLFDTKNERYVYDDTGRATYTLISNYTSEDQGYNTLSEYLLRPDYYSPPRQVKLGVRVGF
ncbi:MAG: TonB-dependent receptor [Candidatus Delongbacteria bacterium]|nr:TonB-dependent receptor [Candidatus Delongbacteria bacterium]